MGLTTKRLVDGVWIRGAVPKPSPHSNQRTHQTTKVLGAFEKALGSRIGCGECRRTLLRYSHIDPTNIDEAELKIYLVGLPLGETVVPRKQDQTAKEHLTEVRAWIRIVLEGVMQQQTQPAPKMQKVTRPRIDVEPLPPNYGYFHHVCTAITSLNPNPKRWDRQRKCLESWVRYGLPVTVVNTQAEIDGFTLPEGVTAIACENMTTLYDRQTQFVSSLVRVGRETGMPFMLINSDIEIHGSTDLLDAALALPETLTIGIRYNHPETSSIKHATRELSGLDVFLMTPQMAATIPEAPFGIGKPVWDYWLPAHFRKEGIQFNWIKQPLFCHERHKIGWTKREWKIGCDYLAKQYGVELGYGSSEFRQSLDLQKT
jgi:hypothetical protein